MPDFETFTGQQGEYGWITIRTRSPLLGSFLKAVPDSVLGRVVAVTSFDSGPLTPNDAERELGWYVEGNVLWTSKITDPSRLPWEQYDEWYVFDAPVHLPELKTLVNYGDFGLEDPRPLYNDNLTCDRSLCEPQLALQKTFWEQLRITRPISYVAEGDRFNLATRDKTVLQQAIEWARNPLGI